MHVAINTVVSLFREWHLFRPYKTSTFPPRSPVLTAEGTVHAISQSSLTYSSVSFWLQCWLWLAAWMAAWTRGLGAKPSPQLHVLQRSRRRGFSWQGKPGHEARSCWFRSLRRSLALPCSWEHGKKRVWFISQCKTDFWVSRVHCCGICSPIAVTGVQWSEFLQTCMFTGNSSPIT